MLVATVAQRCRRRLLAGPARERYNVLLTALADDDTTVAFTSALEGVESGSTIAIDYELMYVVDRDTSARTVTVIRGFEGSTPTIHSAGVLIEVAPRFWLGDIIDTISEEIGSWPPSLFRVKTVDIPARHGTRAYDLTDEQGSVLYLLDVLTDTVSALPFRTNDSSWPSLGGSTILVRDVGRTSFPSGVGVQLMQEPERVGTLRVTYATEFNAADLGPLDDITDDLGIPASWLDIIVYGVVWRLMSTREVGRTDLSGSGEDRRATETPPGFLSQTTTAMLKLRDRRIADEANRLRARWPFRS